MVLHQYKENITLGKTIFKYWFWNIYNKKYQRHIHQHHIQDMWTVRACVRVCTNKTQNTKHTCTYTSQTDCIELTQDQCLQLGKEDIIHQCRTNATSSVGAKIHSTKNRKLARKLCNWKWRCVQCTVSRPIDAKLACIMLFVIMCSSARGVCCTYSRDDGANDDRKLSPKLRSQSSLGTKAGTWFPRKLLPRPNHRWI